MTQFQEKIAVTVAEAVIISSLSRATLYRAIGDGRLPFIKIGRSTRIRVDSLQALLGGEAQGANGPS